MNLHIIVAKKGEKARTYIVHCSSQEEALSTVQSKVTGWTVEYVRTKTQDTCLCIYDNERDFPRFEENFEEVKKIT